MSKRLQNAKFLPLSISLQVYEPGKGLAFHFDKDEHAMKEKQQMVQPVLSSVLYLTGDSTQGRLGIPFCLLESHWVYVQNGLHDWQCLVPCLPYLQGHFVRVLGVHGQYSLLWLPWADVIARCHFKGLEACKKRKRSQRFCQLRK